MGGFKSTHYYGETKSITSGEGFDSTTFDGENYVETFDGEFYNNFRGNIITHIKNSVFLNCQPFYCC